MSSFTEHMQGRLETEPRHGPFMPSLMTVLLYQSSVFLLNIILSVVFMILQIAQIAYTLT